MIAPAVPRASVGVHRTALDPVATPRSTDGRLIYAIGDIHGRYDLFAALLGAVVDDIAAQPAGTAPLLILLGDHIDRGPATDAVLAALVWLWRHAALEVRFLRGNHEAALLDFMDDPRTLPAWREIGGDATLRAYGIDPDGSARDGSPTAPAALRDALLDRMPASHLSLLRDMPTWTTCGDYVFVHAGLRPGVPLDRQEDRDRLSIGEAFRSVDTRFEKVVVHGHGGVSVMAEATRHRIGIDTGAWTTGVLTAVRLDGATALLLQTGGAAHADPAPDRIDAETPDDEEGGSASLRAALSKLRPGY